jgi:hypothetical protein
VPFFIFEDRLGTGMCQLKLCQINLARGMLAQFYGNGIFYWMVFYASAYGMFNILHTNHFKCFTKIYEIGKTKINFFEML